MLKRKLIFLLSIVLTLSACTKPPEKEAAPESAAEVSTDVSTGMKQNDTDSKAVKAISKLLPERIGFKWIYNGFAEYGHTMTLQKIIDTPPTKEYMISGSVADMSGGESGFDKTHFDIEVTYRIEEGRLIQVKKEKMMMDSEFDTLELIQYPLQKGHKWLQVQKDKSGVSKELESEITDIDEEEGRKVYTVYYKDLNSDYYEIRKIMEGYGTVSFTKLWKGSDGNAFEIGYSLYFDAV